MDWYKANTNVFDTNGTCHCQELVRDTIDLHRNSSVFLILLFRMDLLRFITKDNIEFLILLKIPLTNDLNDFLHRFSLTTNESEAVGSSPTRERDDIVSMSGEKTRRSVYLMSESNRSCMWEIFDLRDLRFVMMWMYANLITAEFRSRDDKWNQRNIVHVHN